MLSRSRVTRGAVEDDDNIYSSDVRIAAVGYLHPEISLLVRSQRVRDRPRPLVASDVVRAHARGAQVRTHGRVRFVRRMLFDDRRAGVIAIGVDHLHFHADVEHHGVLVTFAHAPAEFDGVRRKTHVRNLVRVHVHVGLAQVPDS